MSTSYQNFLYCCLTYKLKIIGKHIKFMDLDYSLKIVTYRRIRGNKNLKIQSFYVNLRGLNKSTNSFFWPFMRSAITIAAVVPLVMPQNPNPAATYMFS